MSPKCGLPSVVHIRALKGGNVEMHFNLEVTFVQRESHSNTTSPSKLTVKAKINDAQSRSTSRKMHTDFFLYITAPLKNWPGLRCLFSFLGVFCSWGITLRMNRPSAFEQRCSV